MEFINLKGQYHEIKASVDEAIARVLDHGLYVLGPEVRELEQQLAQFVNVKHCISTSNGTTSLGLALMALGIGVGDEVITSPFSFFASVEVIALLGAKPIFIDIDPLTYNLDAKLLEGAITANTKAIMPVNLFGQPADYKEINKIAIQYNLKVIEDAAQSFGSTHWGQFSGGLGDIGCTSFFPSKPLGCYGDGGACFTNDDMLAARLRQLANHGQVGRYQHELLGLNGRLDSIQAAVLLQKLKIFKQEVAKRTQVAEWYKHYFDNRVHIPQVLTENSSVYAQYTIQCPDRDNVQKTLQLQGIPTAVHYPQGLHQQKAILDLGYEYPHFPVTERAAQSVLSLPFYPNLPEEHVMQVCEALLFSVDAEILL